MKANTDMNETLLLAALLFLNLILVCVFAAAMIYAASEARDLYFRGWPLMN